MGSVLCVGAVSFCDCVPFPCCSDRAELTISYFQSVCFWRHRAQCLQTEVYRSCRAFWRSTLFTTDWIKVSFCIDLRSLVCVTDFTDSCRRDWCQDLIGSDRPLMRRRDARRGTFAWDFRPKGFATWLHFPELSSYLRHVVIDECRWTSGVPQALKTNGGFCALRKWTQSQRNLAVISSQCPPSVYSYAPLTIVGVELVSQRSDPRAHVRTYRKYSARPGDLFIIPAIYIPHREYIYTERLIYWGPAMFLPWHVLWRYSVHVAFYLRDSCFWCRPKYLPLPYRITYI